MRGFIGNCDREVLILIAMNVKSEPNLMQTISIGTLSGSFLHPREVFKAAILSNAASIILAHNHPSLCVDPSEEDKKVTERINEASKIMGITFIDHIIVCDSEEYYSFKENGYL